MDIENLLDTLDAEILTGDALYTDLEILDEHVSRWKRVIEEHKLTLDNEEEIVQNRKVIEKTKALSATTRHSVYEQVLDKFSQLR